MQEKMIIVIINGKPRSGKDTIINNMKYYCEMNECARFYSYSTITPVKGALRSLGWDGNKDDETRDILSEIKQWWISHNDGALKYCVEQILNKNRNDMNVVVFQIREPSEISKLINAIVPLEKAYNIRLQTLLVNRVGASTYCGNTSDRNVEDFKYDAEIMNNGTLHDLRSTVDAYMDNLLTNGGEE